MQVKAMGLQHTPDVSIFLVPETDVERVLLRALWKHGRLEVCNGVADGTGEGFQVTARQPFPLNTKG